MKNFDLTNLALYLAFGMVLTLSGHDISDMTYWLLFALLWAVDVHAVSKGYADGLVDGGDAVKKIWGLK